MTSPQSLKSNFLYSLFGLTLPLLSALVSIPLLFHMLDNSQYGFISLTWIVIGYSSVFDLGLGRSLTKQVPNAMLQNGRLGVEKIVKATLRLMYIICALGVIAIFVFATQLVNIFGKLPPSLWPQAYSSILIIAATMPALVLSSGYRGALEGLGFFRETGLIRAASGSLMFLGPVLVACFSVRLELLTGSLLITRFLTLAALQISYHKAAASLSDVQHSSGVALPSSKGLLHEAGWMTVSNIISPLLVYMDRFFISRILGLTIVPFYTVPYDIVTRLTILPEAVFAVLFPHMSGAHVRGEGELERVYSASLRAMGLIMFLAALTLIAVGPFLMTSFLGAQYGDASGTVMSILLVGVFVNTCARPAYNVLQATGRSRMTGALHLCEFPPYVVLLIFSTIQYGIVGTAMAWLARTAFDMVALTVACASSKSKRISPNPILAIIILAMMVLLGVSMISEWIIRVGSAFAIAITTVFLFANLLVTHRERADMRRAVTKLWVSIRQMASR